MRQLLLFAFLFLAGCDPGSKLNHPKTYHTNTPLTTNGVETKTWIGSDDDHVGVVRIDYHDYAYYRAYSGVAMVHSPNCNCMFQRPQTASPTAKETDPLEGTVVIPTRKHMD